MKTLYLLRHAKSSWDDPTLDDRMRPLNPRGRSAAPLMGRQMKTRGYRPDFVLCSDAVRTLETFCLVRPHLPDDMPGRVCPALYLAEPHGILDEVKGAPEMGPGLLVIGHNPGLEEVLQLLLRDRDEMPDKVPTGALAVLTFPVTRWCEVDAESAALAAFLKPKDFDGA